MQSHGGNIKKYNCIVRFLRTPVALQSENQAVQKKAHDHDETVVVNLVCNIFAITVVLSTPVTRHPLALPRQGAQTIRSHGNFV